MLTLDAVTIAYGPAVAVAEASLTVPDGSVLSLLGPSGCGKSTLLRAIAGLEPLATGRITWDGQDLRRVPVHRRGFGLMFQSGVLFPHLDVAGNIGYGLRTQARSDRRDRVAEMLDLVDLTGLGDRSVSTLSGGQAQRVALARALAPAPRLLLLDEPLAALDTELRERLIETLRRVLAATATTAVHVTHDQREAFALADTVALMVGGRIRQVGSPTQVWAAPGSEWVAEFVGYTSVLDRSALAGVFGPVGAGPGSRVALRPGALVVDPAGRVSAQVTGLMPGPDGLRLRLDVPGLGGVDGTAGLAASVAVGDTVRIRLDPAAVAALPAGNG